MRERERIAMFTKLVQEYGVPDVATFPTESLHEKGALNLAQVCICLRTLGIEVGRLLFATCIRPTSRDVDVGCRLLPVPTVYRVGGGLLRSPTKICNDAAQFFVCVCVKIGRRLSETTICEFQQPVGELAFYLAVLIDS